MDRLTNAAQGYCETYCQKFGRCFAEPGDCKHHGEIAMYERLKFYESIGLTPEQVAAMKQELIDERYRHDRLQDFEVDEAQELARVKADLQWAINYLREAGGCAGCKYEEYMEIDEPCAHCQRLTLQGEDKWEFHGAGEE